jgi:5'-3' exonuclease
MLTGVAAPPKPLALLDAAGLYFRAFHALPASLTAPDGTPVNAVRGFVDTLAKILTERAPGRLVACLDADWRPAFRVEALPGYKAHRLAEDGTEDVPQELGRQVPVILDVLTAAGLATAAAGGFEADDVIGTLVARETRDPVEVVTGDRDLLQVVRTSPTPATVVYLGGRRGRIDVLGEAEVGARYGLPAGGAGPAYAEMAMLRGDPSDGLPGVAGIGEKTAAKLVSQFGSLAAVRAAAEAGNHAVPPRARRELAEASDYLDAAPTVVRVATDAPVELAVADEVPSAPAAPERLRGFQDRWGLGSSIDRLMRALGGG